MGATRELAKSSCAGSKRRILRWFQMNDDCWAADIQAAAVLIAKVGGGSETDWLLSKHIRMCMSSGLSCTRGMAKAPSPNTQL